jgi:hypothetical protein
VQDKGKKKARHRKGREDDIAREGERKEYTLK